MDSLSTLVGDKVKLKRSAGAEAGAHALVLGVDGPRLTLRLTESDRVLHSSIEHVTNLSLAARKAWRNMPARNVGRPKGSKVCDRLSVTIRVDRTLWERFRQAETDGIVEDRTSALNEWISEGLHNLTAPTHRRAS